MSDCGLLPGIWAAWVDAQGRVGSQSEFSEGAWICAERTPHTPAQPPTFLLPSLFIFQAESVGCQL